MSVVIRANNKPDFDLADQSQMQYAWHEKVRVMDGTKEPKIYHFD
jgi:hypothetical protein